MIDTLCTVRITPYPIVPYNHPKNNLLGFGLMTLGGGAGATLATLAVLGSLSFPPALLATLLALSALTFLYGAYAFMKNSPQGTFFPASGEALGVAVRERNQLAVHNILCAISWLAPELREKERGAWKEYVWAHEQEGMRHDLWARWVNESLKKFVCLKGGVPRNLSQVLAQVLGSKDL